MDGEAVKEIERITIDGMISRKVADNEYALRQLHLPPREPDGTAIECTTLQGLVDYLRSHLDEPETGLAVQVVSYRTVHVIGSQEGRHRQRVIPCVSLHNDESVDFLNTWLHPETMALKLQLNAFLGLDFEPVLSVVSKITAERVQQHEDDGISQTVAVKAGVATKAEVKIKNPVSLYLRRTFPEIGEVDGLYILRFKHQNAENVQVGLFEANHAGWNADVAKKIGAWLEDQEIGIPIIR